MDRLIRVCVAIVLACISTSALAETCIASHYGYSGGRTASGERMNPSAMTAAHRSKPFGSQVTVTSQKSGRSVTVRINKIAARSPRAAVSTYPLARPMRSGWLVLKRFRLTEHRGFGCVVRRRHCRPAISCKACIVSGVQEFTEHWRTEARALRVGYMHLPTRRVQAASL